MTTNKSNLRAIPGGASGASTSSTASEAPYDFAPDFTRALVRLACGDREVFSRVGALLAPKLLGRAEATLALQAAQAIAEDTGAGPSTTTAVVQRLVRWRSEGRVSAEQVTAVADYFDEADDAGLPTPEEVIAEAAAIIRRREEQKVVQKAMEVYAKKGDFGAVAKAAEQVTKIGVAGNTLSVPTGRAGFGKVAALGAQAKMASGCFELDDKLHGGFPRGLTLFIGREKSGKSMVLSSLAAEAWYQGKHVLVATLELSETLQEARILANLTNVPIDHLLQGRSGVAEQRFAALEQHLGLLRIQYFAPDVSATDLLAWVDKCAEVGGRPVDLLVVDYIDLLGAGGKGKDDSEYRAQKTVNNTIRDHAQKRGYVAVSAAQAQRETKGGGKLDNAHVSDSIHKVRIPDLVIAMRMESDEKDQVDYFVTAARLGGDRIGTGPLPVDRATARMFPVNRREPW